MAPDLDILIRSAEDSLIAIEYHRHFTHSLAFVPLGALVALLPWLLRRDVRDHLRHAYFISLLGYLTHAPLDCTTTYGTLYFWPLSDYRVSLSWVSVVDPLYTLPMLALVIAAMVKGRPSLARIGLAWSLFYLGLGATQRARALAIQQELAVARGHEPSRRDAFTTFMNQVTWRSLYEADGRIHVDQIRVPYVGTTCVTPGASLLPLDSPAPDAGPGELRGHRLLRWFSSNWVARDPEQPELMGDVRYSLVPYGTRPFWGVVVDREADQAHWVNTRAERAIEMRDVTDLIFRAPSGSLCSGAWKSTPDPKSSSR
jgi:inner membrane protein